MKMKDSKLLLKILSGVAAVVLWFAITYTEDPVINQLLTGIDVVFEGENVLHDNGLIVVNKDAIPDISVVIRGTRSNVISSVGGVSAVVDVSKITGAGENVVQIKYNYPSAYVTLAKAKTREFVLQTEKIIARNVPVEVKVENADKNTGYIIDAKSDTDKVRISGAESVVYKIAYAKVPVDVTNMTVSGDAEYFYQLCDADGGVLPEKNILSKSDSVIPVKSTAYEKVSLPVEVVLLEDRARDYAIEVKKQSVTTISAGITPGTDIKALYAIFDGDKRHEGTEYKMKIHIPEGVYIPPENRELTAECTLVPKILKEIEVPIVAENVPEGKKVKINPDKIRISVKGAESLLVPASVKATVDASRLTPGEEENVEVKLDGKDIQIVGTYTTSVILE